MRIKNHILRLTLLGIPFLIGVLFNVQHAQAQTVEVYPGPGIDTYKSDLYTVEVWDGANWVPSYLYKFGRAIVMWSPVWNANDYVSVNFTTFGTIGSVDVRVSKIGGTTTSIDVGPKSRNIPVQIIGGQAILTLNQNNRNDKTWITLDGDHKNQLFIFADPLKPTVPTGATYFGPGIHILAPSSSNHYQASSNEVIYIDGGAWVRGNIDIRGTTNVKIMGPGVLSGDVWTSEVVNPLTLTDWNSFIDHAMIVGDWNGNAATVSGITIVNSPGFNISSGITHANGIKILSPWYYNTDGFQAVSHVDQSLVYVGDNALFPMWAGVQNDHVTVTNTYAGTSLSAIVAGGYWGLSPSNTYTSLIDNVDFRTYNAAPHPVFQIWVDNADPASGYSNQTYQNIWIEGNITSPLIQMIHKVYPWPGSPAPDPPLGNNYNFVSKNITLTGTQMGKSEIKGYDANNGFHSVVLENVSINGTVVDQSNLSNHFDVNSFVWGLPFSPPPTIYSFTATPSTIPSGSSSTLAWSSDATSCTASGAWSGSMASSGNQSVTPTANSTYILTCINNGGGLATKSVTVNVSQVNPVAVWTLNETSGTTASDTSGSGYHGALFNGPTWTTGKVGNALSFDGVDDQIKISNATALRSLAGMTLSAWINPRSAGGNGAGYGTLFSKSGIVGSVAYFRFMMPDNSSLQLNGNYLATVGSWKTPTGSVSLNTWQHVVLIYTHGDINSTPKIYINGVLQNLTTLSTPSGGQVSDDDILYIGSRGVNPTVGVFDGAIDQVRVYNREITASEVTSLYNSENVSALEGDLNLDKIVNSLDWSIMNKWWNTSNTTSDINGDGIVNSIDFSRMNLNWFKTVP